MRLPTTQTQPAACGSCLLAMQHALACQACDANSVALRGARREVRRRATAFGAMLVAALLWGTSFLFIEHALESYRPATITFARCLIGAIVVGAAALLMRQWGVPVNARISRRDARVSLVAAGTLTAGALLGVALGQQYASSTVAGVILGTVPVWTALLALVILRGRGESATFSPLLACSLALGLVASIIPVLGGHASAAPLGALILLGAALCHAGSMVTVSAGVARYGPVRNTTLVMLIASLALVPAALVAGIPTSPELVPTLALIEVAVFPTGVAYIAFFYAVSVIGASRATFAIYLIPAVALFGGVIIEGSALSMASVAGAACALGAVGLIAYEQRTVRATAR